MQSACILTRTI